MSEIRGGLFSRLKASIEKRAPLAARLYRMIRTEMQYKRMLAATTPYGFKFIGDEAMQNGRFEPEETRIIQHYLDAADILVDVGANTGLYSCLARHMGKHAVAIEPHPDNLRLLFRNLEENGWDDIEVWPIGVAERATTITLYGGSTGASVVKGWADIPETWKQRISVHPLDRILDFRFTDKRMVIKVDVEGAEYGVLLGALRTLDRSPKPVWLVEITLTLHHPEANRHFLKTFEMFWQHGYEARTGDSVRRLVERGDVERWVSSGVSDFGSHNWLFVPKS